ncbi:hypothetical protein DIPPA_08956 [Diplonema papillatum]|nr:hypothetical protein DIPPA_08956 [Diplonema papillatum]
MTGFPGLLSQGVVPPHPPTHPPPHAYTGSKVAGRVPLSPRSAASRGPLTATQKRQLEQQLHQQAAQQRPTPRLGAREPSRPATNLASSVQSTPLPRQSPAASPPADRHVPGGKQRAPRRHVELPRQREGALLQVAPIRHLKKTGSPPTTHAPTARGPLTKRQLEQQLHQQAAQQGAQLRGSELASQADPPPTWPPTSSPRRCPASPPQPRPARPAGRPPRSRRQATRTSSARGAAASTRRGASSSGANSPGPPHPPTHPPPHAYTGSKVAGRVPLSPRSAASRGPLTATQKRQLEQQLHQQAAHHKRYIQSAQLRGSELASQPTVTNLASSVQSAPSPRQSPAASPRQSPAASPRPSRRPTATFPAASNAHLVGTWSRRVNAQSRFFKWRLFAASRCAGRRRADALNLRNAASVRRRCQEAWMTFAASRRLARGAATSLEADELTVRAFYKRTHYPHLFRRAEGVASQSKIDKAEAEARRLRDKCNLLESDAIGRPSGRAAAAGCGDVLAAPRLFGGACVVTAFAALAPTELQLARVDEDTDADDDLSASSCQSVDAAARNAGSGSGSDRTYETGYEWVTDSQADSSSTDDGIVSVAAILARHAAAKAAGRLGGITDPPADEKPEKKKKKKKRILRMSSPRRAVSAASADFSEDYGSLRSGTAGSARRRGGGNKARKGRRVSVSLRMPVEVVRRGLEGRLAEATGASMLHGLAQPGKARVIGRLQDADGGVNVQDVVEFGPAVHPEDTPPRTTLLSLEKDEMIDTLQAEVANLRAQLQATKSVHFSPPASPRDRPAAANALSERASSGSLPPPSPRSTASPALPAKQRLSQPPSPPPASPLDSVIVTESPSFKSNASQPQQQRQQQQRLGSIIVTESPSFKSNASQPQQRQASFSDAGGRKSPGGKTASAGSSRAGFKVPPPLPREVLLSSAATLRTTSTVGSEPPPEAAAALHPLLVTSGGSSDAGLAAGEVSIVQRAQRMRTFRERQQRQQQQQHQAADDTLDTPVARGGARDGNPRFEECMHRELTRACQSMELARSLSSKNPAARARRASRKDPPKSAPMFNEPANPRIHYHHHQPAAAGAAAGGTPRKKRVCGVDARPLAFPVETPAFRSNGTPSGMRARSSGGRRRRASDPSVTTSATGSATPDSPALGGIDAANRASLLQSVALGYRGGSSETGDSRRPSPGAAAYFPRDSPISPLKPPRSPSDYLAPSRAGSGLYRTPSDNIYPPLPTPDDQPEEPRPKQTASSPPQAGAHHQHPPGMYHFRAEKANDNGLDTPARGEGGGFEGLPRTPAQLLYEEEREGEEWGEVDGLRGELERALSESAKCEGDVLRLSNGRNKATAFTKTALKSAQRNAVHCRRMVAAIERQLADAEGRGGSDGYPAYPSTPARVATHQSGRGGPPLASPAGTAAPTPGEARRRAGAAAAAVDVVVRKTPSDILGATFLDEHDLVLESVDPETPAALHGLDGCLGQRLTHISGNEVRTCDDVRQLAAGASHLILRFDSDIRRGGFNSM